MPDRSLQLLVLSAMFQTPSPDTTRACLALLDRVARDGLDKLTWHSLNVFLEDHRFGAPDDDVWQALIRSGIFREEAGALVAQREIAVVDYFNETAPRDEQTFAIEDLADFVAEATEATPDTPMSSLPVLGGAIRRAQLWGLECMQYAAREDLPGFPVFWDCAQGEHTPFATEFGSMTVSETLLLWAEGFRYGVEPQIGASDGSVARAWSVLLGLGNTADGWYNGAVRLPYFDDDFVGAFNPRRAAEGSCPTTDATAQRMYTLCRLATQSIVLDPDGELRLSSEEAVRAAARCLLRWQDPGGGWAIHRYPPGSRYTAAVRDISTRYASEALLVGLASGLLDDALAEEVRVALRRLADFLLDRADRAADEVTWLGDFVLDDAASRMRATTITALYCGALASVLGDRELAGLHRGAITYLTRRWTPGRVNLIHVDFRVPTWEGLATDSFSWDMPTDALIVTAALDWAARGGTLSKATRGLVDSATAEILAGESHGHWLDLLMAASGSDRGFPQNSLHSLRALLAIASWQTSTFPDAPGPGFLG